MCSFEKDWERFYPPNLNEEDGIKDMFTSMMCVDEPEKFKFFGSFNTDFGNQLLIDFVEC